MAEYVITGAAGQVGTALLAAGPDGVTGLSRADMDVSDFGEVERRLRDCRPRTVIHAGAWTDVDGCEGDPGKAWRVNAHGTANVAQACAGLGARLIYISTDYVFSGDFLRPYEPEDAVRPLSVYGATKLAGELAVRSLLPRMHAIVRTSWVFSPRGRNFVRTILRLAGSGAPVQVVNDQRGSPTSAQDLAVWLWRLADVKLSGTIHACNAEDCTWWELAAETVRLAAYDVNVLPVSTLEFARPAKRPPYSVLSTKRLQAEAFIRPRPWKVALAEVVRTLSGGPTDGQTSKP